LLPGAVEVLLGTDQVDEAARAGQELDEVALTFGTAALRAMAHYASGSCLLASSLPGEAVTELRAAQKIWKELDAPYEVARTRLLVGRALRDLADEESAVVELGAARRAFAELGTTPLEREAARLVSPATPGGLTEREVEVLRLVAAGKTNPEIAALLVLSEKTVARHLSNIFTKIDVTSRTAAAAFAFEHRLM
jgi:DNA-binding NarL/FixJ family response regulator